MCLGINTFYRSFDLFNLLRIVSYRFIKNGRNKIYLLHLQRLIVSNWNVWLFFFFSLVFFQFLFTFFFLSDYPGLSVFDLRFHDLFLNILFSQITIVFSELKTIDLSSLVEFTYSRWSFINVIFESLEVLRLLPEVCNFVCFDTQICLLHISIGFFD